MWTSDGDRFAVGSVLRVAAERSAAVMRGPRSATSRNEWARQGREAYLGRDAELRRARGFEEESTMSCVLE